MMTPERNAATSELQHMLIQRLDAQASDISEIRLDVKDVKVQTTVTNGRVTKLELQRERERGAEDERNRLSKSRQYWFTACITMASSSVCGIVVFLLSH